MIPDLTDEVKLLHIGRMSVLYKARRDAARRLREKLVPMLNHIEGDREIWNVDGVVEMVAEINALNDAIAELN